MCHVDAYLRTSQTLFVTILGYLVAHYLTWIAPSISLRGLFSNPCSRRHLYSLDLESWTICVIICLLCSFALFERFRWIELAKVVASLVSCTNITDIFDSVCHVYTSLWASESLFDTILGYLVAHYLTWIVSSILLRRGWFSNPVSKRHLYSLESWTNNDLSANFASSILREEQGLVQEYLYAVQPLCAIAFYCDWENEWILLQVSFVSLVTLII